MRSGRSWPPRARRRGASPGSVRVGPRAAVELDEMVVEMACSPVCLLDHLGESLSFRFEDLDLAVDSFARVDDQRALFGRVASLPVALPIAFPRRVVLEQLADLGQREPGVIAQAPDELQAI